MAKCIVFGGAGFIGSHIAAALVNNGHDVTVFDTFPLTMANLNPIKDSIKIIRGDFLNEKDMDGILKGIDYVFHYISTTVPVSSKNDPVYDVASNIIGSVKLFQAAVKNNVKRIVFPSSGGTIYGEPENVPVRETEPLNPLDPYAISKLAIEKYLHYFYHAQGLNYTVVRYSNPYGEGQNPHGMQGVIPIFLAKVKEGQQPVIYGDGSTIRDYIYIEDAVAATIALVEKPVEGHVFNVGSGEGTSLNELVDIMSKVVGKKIKPQYIPDSRHYIQKIVLDTSKIRHEIGWKPETSIHEGIRKTWEWICSGGYNG
jgi:UDP-glucose 4-epimerase